MPVHTLSEPAVRRLDTHPRVSAESIKLQQQVYDHQGNVGQGVTPILVFDAWEHAFYLRYGNQKVDFFEAMWQVVNRQDVARRYEAAQSRADVLLPAP